ncbi:MAG TPA: hypothetical protein VGF99_12375 [Myxococcota bacterium]
MVADKDTLDLAATLRAIGVATEPEPALDAVFFHRTLARWLGLPEGRVVGVSAPVQWDYRYWKAELRREPERDASVGVVDAVAWCALLSSTADGPVEVVRWWVKKDAAGRIADAGWSSAPPRLLDRSVPSSPPVPALPDPATLARLFHDDDDVHPADFDDDDVTTRD